MVTEPTEPDRSSNRRRLGQVFTPRPVARWMVRWSCADRPRRILDPALGEGVFIEEIESFFDGGADDRPPRIDAYEVDRRLLGDFRSKPRSIPTRCHLRDFVLAPIRTAYDAVLANPPYVRHNALPYQESLFGRFDRLCGRRVSRMTNLYGLFLLKISSLLSPRGRAAVIVPAEWLNADFGRPIKAYLLQQNLIDGLIHFDHRSRVFDDALTTASIALLRRGRSPNEPVKLISVEDVESLSATNLRDARRCDPARLDPDRKWTPLFDAADSEFDGDRPRLGDVARCTRGIATGANHYFTLRESDRRRRGIDLRDLVYCITKAPHVSDNVLTTRDVRRLVREDRRIFLLSPRTRLSAAVLRYLEEGYSRNIHGRYLPAHRSVWFRPETRDPAPILVNVFGRRGFRFVLNRTKALNLTAFHGIFLHDPNPQRIRAIWDYLITAEAQAELRHHRRIYADGLMKLEPRDVEALPIPVELYELCRSRTSSPLSNGR